MRRAEYSTLFKKKFNKIKGKELQNILTKIEEIKKCTDLNHYKNLTKNLKKYKRVHVNNSYVILFFDDDGCVYFVDYAHHDEIYKHNKKGIRRFDNLKF